MSDPGEAAGGAPRLGRLAGKVALVTGTAGGIGRASALLFAHEGAQVVGCDLDATGATETAAMVTEAGGQIASLQPVDLTVRGDVERLVAFAVSAYGGIDVLYNNAGRAEFAPIPELTDKAWRDTLAAELDSVFLVCRSAWPHLVEAAGAAIVNTGSYNGHRVVPGLPAAAHTAAKGGLLALTRQLAIEGAPHRIRANSVSPGVVRTPATEPLLATAAGAEQARRTVLLDRLGEPHDIASMALFLCSEEASWVTGADFLVDGGSSIF